MSDHTIFMFNATSADKPPGSGVMERISPTDKKQNVYAGLRKISNWRKMLSNEFPMNNNSKIGIDGLVIDNNKWNSVEHYLMACHVKEKSPNQYEKLTSDGEYGNETIANLKTILKIKKYESIEEDMQKALEAKFDYEKNPYLCKMLLATNNATLTSWKRGMACDVDADGNKFAQACHLTEFLMKLRDKLLLITTSDKSTTHEQTNNDSNNAVKTKSQGTKKNTRKRNEKTKLNEGGENLELTDENPDDDTETNDYDNKDSTTSEITNDSTCISTITNASGCGSIHNDVKILSKKEIDNYSDFISKYNPDNNKSSNILTVYEKTNILGIRMEQLALGADSYLDHDRATKIGDVKEIAKQEFEEKKIPFIICRLLADNTKEYWKLEHMIHNNCYV
jgi:DNA-directed RNA polymerase subunit K/omega/predicted NAD-dependent protein-ADP-ribosyltransferase YbiA (DUF1768 family)